MSDLKSLYLAAPLFTVAERWFNQSLARSVESLSRGCHVEMPQVAAQSVPFDSGFAEQVFALCIEMIDRCDAVLAVLDGSDADSGTCVELGYALAKGKPIIGIRTDLRACEDQGLNLMVSQLCDKLLVRTDREMNVDCLAAEVVPLLEKLWK